MSVDAKKLTYEEYLAMPEMKCRYEIIDGELMMAASPIPMHQWIVGNIYRVLHCWIVSPEAMTIEVVQLAAEGMHTLDIYGMGTTMCSEVLEGFAMPVAEVFA